MMVQSHSRTDLGVGRLLLQKGLTLSVCESCTAGMLAASITSVAGSSAYFTGGIIAYADSVKSDVVRVKKTTLRRFGAVSARAAQEMACGVRKITMTDVGVSITGIAGPSGGSARKPVGLVYIGVATGKAVTVRRCMFKGNRSAIRRAAVRRALLSLRETLGRSAS